MSIDQDKFAGFIAEFEAAFSNGTFEDVLCLWSREAQEPWHQPEELEAPLIGWQALTAYVNSLNSILKSFEAKISNEHIKQGPGDSVLFRFVLDWKAIMLNADRPIAARVSASGLLHEIDGKYRLLHYIESGPAALPFVRAAYETAASRKPWA